ncbi:MAG: hypothetical protein EOO42_14480 [Flavobacteriales bacterium]|nr:MAG: hypothetical protein EOO42_14480 [Flavobacteriales bacterium]
MDFNPETTEYTFAQLKFLHYLQNAIIKLLKSIVDDDYETLLVDYLIFLNFNATLLVAYVKKGMLTKLSALFNEQERYFFLCEEENRLQSTALKQDSVFDPSQDSLKTQLLDLITAGIVRYHRQQPIKANFAPHSKDNDSYRIKMTISADVLAYLIRLFIEAGVIEAEPRSKLLVFLAEHCQTTGIGDAKLSVNSLSTKYKQVVQRTAIGVRTMLRKMVKIVDQNFEIK